MDELRGRTQIGLPLVITDANSCPNCGAVLPADVTEDRCPRCQTHRTNSVDATAGSDVGDPTVTTVPGVEQSPKSTQSDFEETGAYHAEARAETATTDATGRWSDAPTGPAEDRGTRRALAQGTAVRYFGDYELLSEIARGGMGVVYKARQTSLRRYVALKMILAGNLAGEAEVRRFHLEAESAASLDHVGIVPIHEVGQHEGQHYYSMGFVEGQSLAHRVAEGPLPPRQAATLMVQIAEAVQYAHEKGVIHRDLKPGNVLLDAQGRPRVTDFGLAKRMQSDSGMTASGQIMGTPSYMPPEQARGSTDVGPLSDVYSLGAVLYCSLTGRPPFQSASAMDTLKQVLEKDPPTPHELNAAIPLDLETIALKCLQKEPRRRYGSARELAEDLTRFLSGEPIRARKISAYERYWRWARRNPTIAVLGGVLTAVLVLVTIGSVLAAGLFKESATAERGARIESDQARKTAQRAEVEMERIAAQAEADKETAQRESYRSTIKLAESMLQGDTQARYRVADILWGAQPELRGWEWGHLMARCPLEQWSLQTNQGGLDTLAASADGRFLATAGGDGTVALWDSWTRRELWRQKTGRVKKLAIDPRSRHVGVGSADVSQPSFRILDVETGRFVHEAARTGSADIAFSPSGKDLYVLDFGSPPLGRTSESEGNLERFGTDTWERLASVVMAPIHFPGDLKLFVDSAGVYVGVHDVFLGFSGRSPADPEVLLYDAQGLRPSADLDPILPRYSSTIRPATPFLHSGFGEIVYSDSLSLHRNSRSGPFLYIPHSGIVDYISFDPRSGRALAGSNDGTVTIRDADGESQALSHGSSINGLTLFPDGRLVTGGRDGLLKCWTPGLAAKLAIHTSAEPASAQADLVAFANDGASLLFPQRANFQLFRTRDLTYRSFPLKAVGEYAGRALLIEPKTNELVVATETGLSFYDLFRNGTGLVKTRSIDVARPYHAAFDASGRILVVSNYDQEVAVFDVGSKKRLSEPEVRGVGVVSVNPAGTRASLLTSTSLQVWEVATGRLLNRLDGSLGAVQTENWNYSQCIPVFHRDGDLLAFVAAPKNSPSSLILWDTALGKVRSSVQERAGVGFGHLVFSPDGNRIFVCGNQLWIWDWRIGKELLALPAPRGLAASPDGVTIATAGWNPSLRIAKALPWNKLTRGDGDLYRAVDDLWMYTAGLPRSMKMMAESTGAFDSVLADEAEILGDIQRRRGQPAAAIAHYNKAIEIRQCVVLADPKMAEQHYRLATVYEKRLAVDHATGAAVLQQAVEFWQKLVSEGPHHECAWRYCLDFQLRLVDFQLARSGMDARELLLPQIRFWCERSHEGPHDRLVRYGLHEFWARMAAAAPGFLGDQKAIDELVDRHPELRVIIGEHYAAARNWDRAIAIFSKPITVESGFDHVRNLLDLAAAQGKDGPPLDDAAKAKLRRQALDWLQAELVASTRRLESGPPQDLPTLAQTLQFWKKNSDLAGIRETESLAKLPADEQKMWQTLWADVDLLLKRLPTPEPDETKLDPDNPETLEGIHMRAHELAPLKPSEAEPLFRQALQGYRKLQGPDGPLTLDLTLDLANLLNESGRGADAEPLLRDALEPLRKQPGPDDFRMAGILAPLGLSLIQQGKWTEAEPVLRECLVVRESLQPDEWTTFTTRSLLGVALLGQKKYAESEPLIVSGYEGMKSREAKIPPRSKPRLTEASEQLVKLYEAWGKKDKVTELRAKLARPADQPEPQP